MDYHETDTPVRGSNLRPGSVPACPEAGCNFFFPTGTTGTDRTDGCRSTYFDALKAEEAVFCTVRSAESSLCPPICIQPSPDKPERLLCGSYHFGSVSLRSQRVTELLSLCLTFGMQSVLLSVGSSGSAASLRFSRFLAAVLWDGNTGPPAPMDLRRSASTALRLHRVGLVHPTYR